MTESKGYDPEVYARAAEQRGLDLDALARALAATLARRLDVVEVTVEGLRIPEGAGTSSGTVLFSATWKDSDGEQRRDLVARTQPDKVQLFREPDFRKQYVVIDALHRSGRVKVAEGLFFEDDPSVIGVPFFVMSQLHGRVPVSFPGYNVEGFLFEATPTERRGAWESAIEELCRIALVPVDEFAFLDQPQYGERAIDQQLEYWRQSVDWSTDNQTPDPVWAMYEWLAANVPGVKVAVHQRVRHSAGFDLSESPGQSGDQPVDPVLLGVVQLVAMTLHHSADPWEQYVRSQIGHAECQQLRCPVNPARLQADQHPHHLK